MKNFFSKDEINQHTDSSCHSKKTTILISVLLISICMGMTSCSSTKPRDTQTDGQSSSAATNASSVESVDDSICQIPTGKIKLAAAYITDSSDPSFNPDVPKKSADPALQGRYLDGTRELKSAYTLSEALEKYAIRLYDSTLIYTAADEFSPSCSYRLVDSEQNLYSIRASFSILDAIDNTSRFGEVESIYLWDTEYKTLKEFKDALNSKLIGHPTMFDLYEYVQFSSSKIYSETEDFIFASQINKVTRDDMQKYYQVYIAARCIGHRVYFAYCFGTNENGGECLSDNGRAEFEKYAKILFAHLSEDDGKEPYLCDKIVNTELPGGMHIKNFNVLYEAKKNKLIIDDGYYFVNSWRVDVYYGNNEEGEMQWGVLDPWKEVGDIQLKKLDQHGIIEAVMTKEATTYYVIPWKEVPSAYEKIGSEDDLFAYIEKTGLMER